MTGLRNTRRGAAIALAAGLAAVALAALLGAVAAAAPAAFLHVRFNLSQTPTSNSIQPDLAANADGTWVAAVWTEEFRGGLGYVNKGDVYLRAASEAGAGWGSKIRVFTGTEDACAYAAAVAITGTTAHVAYVVFKDKCVSPSQVQVRHRTCSLSQGWCSPQEYLVTAVSMEYNKITGLDLALDAAGNPHIVWPQYDKSGENGTIYYKGVIGSTWVGPEPLTSGGNNHAPTIAWADNYAHVVWTDQVGQDKSIERGIYYRRRLTARPDVAWDSLVIVLGQQAGPNNPDVAAAAGRVFVVWDWCFKDPVTGSCAWYYLAYRSASSSGAYWSLDTREVGTDYLYGSTTDEWTKYDSLDDLASRVLFLVDLQPSITLNREGLLAVAWHADRSGGDGTDYMIYYSYALTGTDWITRTVLYDGQPTMWSAPVVGVGEPTPGEPHLHVAYMQKLSASAWDVYYDSNESAKYRYHYLPLVMKAYLH